MRIIIDVNKYYKYLFFYSNNIDTFVSMNDRQPTSEKVKQQLHIQGRNKSWLAEKLGMSRPTLYERLDDNCWLPSEIIKLKQLGVIRN